MRRPPKPSVADPNLGFGGNKQQSLSSAAAHSFLWTGHIIHVDVETMVCSLAIDLGGASEWHDVPLPAPAGSGPRSWAGCIPEPGTKVLVEWKRYDDRNFQPYIVGFMTVGTFPARQYEPYSTCDPKEAAMALTIAPELQDDPRYRLDIIRLKVRKAYGGDFVASSSSGADFLLDRDSTLQNRAGNEFKLRDSDQTAVLQTVNEFVSSAAGFYRRGLVRRNAYNLLPDFFLSAQNRDFGMIGDKTVEAVLTEKTKTLENADGEWSEVLVDQISPSSPGFEKWKEFGFVDDAGYAQFPDQSDPFYPFVVMPDGRRQSYIVHGPHDLRWDQTDECYVEDRAEIFHTHDGVMAVTEEGDGVQVDHALKRVFIEDVKGTVVGNDPYTDPGRTLYKKILSMSLFKSLDDMSEPHVGFFAVDTTQSPSAADRIALARLFRISSPTDDANEFVFGVTKEGRAYLCIPASQDLKESLDFYAQGGVKAFLGTNVDRISLNMKTTGGVRLDIGTFKDDASEDQDAVSMDVTYRGKLIERFVGGQGRETIVGGTQYSSISNSKVDVVGGSAITQCGGTHALEAEGSRMNMGTGGFVMRSLGSYDITALDKASESYSKSRTTTNYQGHTKMTVSGVDSTVVTAGSMTAAVAAGTYSVTVGGGAMTMTSGGGAPQTPAANLSMTGGGNTTITGGGAVTSTAGGTNTMAGTVASLMAPMVKIGMSSVGNVVAGVPGPPGPHRDFITGQLIYGCPTTFVGP
jgi:hypothetical protein